MRSHKTRLFLVSTLTVGMVLAIVFTAIVIGVRHKVVVHKESEMLLALTTGAAVKDGRFVLDRFREAFPSYSASVYDQSGKLLQSSGPLKTELMQGFEEHGSFVTVGTKIGEQLVVSSSEWTPVEHGLDDLAFILASLWLPLTLLVGVATWLGAQSVFRHLEKLRLQAAEIRGSDLKRRVAIQDRAEFGEFAEQLNQMLDRIEQAVRREEEFATDAAHEFRTPLAIMKMQIQTTLLKERSPEEYTQSLEVMLAEVSRLSGISESLLQSARGIETQAPPLDLAQVVGEVVKRSQTKLSGGEPRLQLETETALVQISADEVGILLDNLISNAVRYGAEDKPIQIKLHKNGSWASLSVHNRGSCMTPEVQEKVFERFYRGEESRNRQQGGAGVGLSVCKRIVESRGGTISVENTELGTAFVSKFPIAS